MKIPQNDQKQNTNFGSIKVDKSNVMKLRAAFIETPERLKPVNLKETIESIANADPLLISKEEKERYFRNISGKTGRDEIFLTPREDFEFTELTQSGIADKIKTKKFYGMIIEDKINDYISNAKDVTQGQIAELHKTLSDLFDSTRGALRDFLN